MNREQFIAQLARLLQDLPSAERQEAIRYYQEYFDDAGEENEDAVIQELGSPGKVAASIKANLQYGGYTSGKNPSDMEDTEQGSYRENTWQQSEQDKNAWEHNSSQQGQGAQQQTWQNTNTQSTYAMQARKPKRGVGGWALLIIVLVFASPMILGVGGGVLGILIGLLATVFALWISCFAVSLGMIGGGVAVLIKGVIHAIGSPAAGLVGMGGGLICIALGILGAVFFVWFTFQLCPRVLRATLNFISRIVHRGKEAKAE